ncbi:MAG: hypothetical protein H6R15_461 [Proteobacteria bacterium]|nr:hypothetical protein [Pseudomonadota bacterium]
MWSSVLKVLGGSLLTFAIVWGLVLAWWQSNDYEPSRIDLALYLGALPLALVGGYLLLRGFIEHLKAPPPATPPPAPAMLDDDPLAGKRAQTAAAERSFSLCLVDAFLSAPAGASADDILAAIEAGKRPEPGSRLADDEGFPVFLAEVPDLDVDGMGEKLAEESGAIRQLFDQEAVQRALALLDGVLEKAQHSMAGWFAEGADKPHLQVLWLVPGDWSPSHFPALRTWLQVNYWPTLNKTDLEIAVLPVSNEAAAMRQVDEIILRANREASNNELFLLAGAVSAVDEQTVDKWAAGNKLFSAKHQDRKIPGEGAVALLLASRAMVERLALPEATVISRVSQGPRDKPVDAGGRISGKLIEQLIAGLLDVSAVESPLIKTVVFDGDHRPGLVTEALEGLGESFSHLDPLKDCLATGTVNGALAPIGSLLALACARSKVLATESPVLCLSNQHELDRAVLLATPFVARANTEPSPT